LSIVTLLFDTLIFYFFDHFVFFFHDTATTEIYTLSLHDALPISLITPSGDFDWDAGNEKGFGNYSDEEREKLEQLYAGTFNSIRSEEHTSELQSRENLVCRLLLEKKKHIYYKSKTS